MDPTIIAAAIVTVIAAVVGGTVQVVNAFSAARDRREAAVERKALLDKTELAAHKAEIVAIKAEAIAERAKVADEKLDKIQLTTTESSHNVNGNLTAVRDELTKSTAHSKALQETVNTLAEALRLQRASIVSIDTAVNGSARPVGDQAVVASIKETAENTAQIEKNTARTDATVQELKKEP